jgi:uncharacterized protein YndB with AHSA1/START domain
MTTTMATNSLRVSRIINATPDALFTAWTDPAQLRKWWRMDGEGWSTSETSLDLRVGGKYRFGMVAPDTSTSPSGTARVASTRLAFTWSGKIRQARRATIVTTNLGRRTAPRSFTHEGFDDGRRPPATAGLDAAAEVARRSERNVRLVTERGAGSRALVRRLPRPINRCTIAVTCRSVVSRTGRSAMTALAAMVVQCRRG